MRKPHTFAPLPLLLCLLLILSACGGQSAPSSAESSLEVSSSEELASSEPAFAGLAVTGTAELSYAEQFTIQQLEGGYSLIAMADDTQYLVVPAGKEPPEGLPGDVAVIRQPMEKVYLAATAAMCFFDTLGHGDAIRFSGSQAEDWSIAYAREAMERGEIVYAGKYREPDYELLLSGGCGLTVQSSMINHAPEAREKLEELGITVVVDRSSFEGHPLGRSEWVKFYGALLGEEDKAQALFDGQKKLFDETESLPETGKTAAYFYFTAEGQPVTRGAGDYITAMIGLAGGGNALAHVEGGGETATITMEMEDFYTAAKDADVLIYNGDMSGDLESMEQLTAINPLMEDFKAVQEGNVWCAKRELFQSTLEMGTVVADFHKVLAGEGEPEFLYKLT